MLQDAAGTQREWYSFHGRSIRVENIQDGNRCRRFFIEPEQYRLAKQLAMKWKIELLGFYHFHPDHPAAPSAFDTDHAMPWFS